MNPTNLLFVEAADTAGTPGGGRVLQFCESLTEHAYVYLVRPSNRPMEDTPGGVRILSHNLNRLPRFGSLEGVVAVGDPHLLPILRENYSGILLHLLMEQAGAEALALAAKYRAYQLLGGLGDKVAQLLGHSGAVRSITGRSPAIAS